MPWMTSFSSRQSAGSTLPAVAQGRSHGERVDGPAKCFERPGGVARGRPRRSTGRNASVTTGGGGKSMSATQALSTLGVLCHFAPGLACSQSSESESNRRVVSVATAATWDGSVRVPDRYAVTDQAVTHWWMRRMPSSMSASAMAKREPGVAGGAERLAGHERHLGLAEDRVGQLERGVRTPCRWGRAGGRAAPFTFG